MTTIPSKKILLTAFILFWAPVSAHPRKKNITPERSLPEKTKIAQMAQRKTDSITVKNVITPDMTAYHYLGKHTPEQFSLELNGQKIDPQTEKKVELAGNCLEATYHYSFAKGLYKGSKTCPVAIPENVTKNAVVHFSWHKQPRVWLEKGD